MATLAAREFEFVCVWIGVEVVSSVERVWCVLCYLIGEEGDRAGGCGN